MEEGFIIPGICGMFAICIPLQLAQHYLNPTIVAIVTTDTVIDFSLQKYLNSLSAELRQMNQKTLWFSPFIVCLLAV